MSWLLTLFLALGLTAVAEKHRPGQAHASIWQGGSSSPSDVAPSHDVPVLATASISPPPAPSFTVPLVAPLYVNPWPRYLQKLALLL